MPTTFCNFFTSREEVVCQKIFLCALLPSSLFSNMEVIFSCLDNYVTSTCIKPTSVLGTHGAERFINSLDDHVIYNHCDRNKGSNLLNLQEKTTFILWTSVVALRHISSVSIKFLPRRSRLPILKRLSLDIIN